MQVELKARSLLANVAVADVTTSSRPNDVGASFVNLLTRERSRQACDVSHRRFPALPYYSCHRCVCSLQEVELMFADALAAFPSSARLHWFVSQYVRTFKKNRHIEQLHLMAAEVCGFL